MLSEQQNLTFLWRCSNCPAVYDGESISFLLDDGTSKACTCGGRLMEGVGPAPDHENHAGYGLGYGLSPLRTLVGVSRGV